MPILGQFSVLRAASADEGRWDREDDARWRKRAAEIAAEVAKDLPWLAKTHEVED
jgi:hypothetical protein